MLGPGDATRTVVELWRSFRRLRRPHATLRAIMSAQTPIKMAAPSPTATDTIGLRVNEVRGRCSTLKLRTEFKTRRERKQTERVVNIRNQMRNVLHRHFFSLFSHRAFASFWIHFNSFIYLSKSFCLPFSPVDGFSGMRSMAAFTIVGSDRPFELNA